MKDTYNVLSFGRKSVADFETPDYLLPYSRAVKRHGAGFGSLLWASPTTQATRFAAFETLCELHGRSILDVGCGRADLLEYLISKGIQPCDYIGIEAMDVLAEAAETKKLPRCTIVHADFVREPIRLFAGADVVLFSGSLNTLDEQTFYATIDRAFDATAEVLMFNFLASSTLAGRNYLSWRPVDQVLAHVQQWAAKIQTLDNYLPGDYTIAVHKMEDDDGSN
jgi:SAM-dependent methyltransferase